MDLNIQIPSELGLKKSIMVLIKLNDFERLSNQKIFINSYYGLPKNNYLEDSY